MDECVTLHSNFVEMSYELNIKMKCLGDVNNCLIPPRRWQTTLAMIFSTIQCGPRRLYDSLTLVPCDRGWHENTNNGPVKSGQVYYILLLIKLWFFSQLLLKLTLQWDLIVKPQQFYNEKHFLQIILAVFHNDHITN